MTVDSSPSVLDEIAARASAPRVSVVVPTRNRATLLSRLLSALDAQTYAHFDVWVIDDASNDATPDLLSAWAREDRMTLRNRSSTGAYASRNRGWRAASGTMIAFTDDDCFPAPDWLASLVHAMGGPGTVGVQGVTLPQPGTPTPFTHQIEQRRPGTPYRTCNIAYRRTTLDELGGFDDSFRHGADTLLGLRARACGSIAFAPNAVVYHPPRKKDWRDRAAWERRFREDVRFRREALRFGIMPDERRDIEPYVVRGLPLPVVMWIIRPLQHQLRFHLRYLLAHPRVYLRGVPSLARERWEMLLALASFWLRLQ
ncbi:MAG: glycosyltransferase family 2 protein [Chloroflexota bacterium]|nr:MAG: hypothetical protein DLM70_17010 [Chloroflexota bacterium]